MDISNHLIQPHLFVTDETWASAVVMMDTLSLLHLK